MDYSMLSFFGFTIVIFGITVLSEKLDEKRELKLRQTDSNDGWTKGHYKLLYEQRLKELKRKKK
jgi:hypothetical protein